MKLIKTEEAVGHVLCHDITQIIKGVTKDAVFRKGHIVTEDDIPVLLSIGKENLYVWENNENMLHENEAARILYDISADSNMHGSEIKEGKIELIADIDGVLMIDRDKLRRINSLGQMMIAGRHSGFPVKKGDKLAGTRIIPLVIEKEKMEDARKIGGNEPIFTLKPYTLRTAGVVTTGSEIFKNRIEDTFTPVIEEKLSEYGISMVKHAICSDNHEDITEEINKMLEAGVDMVICTGGMSVDPDDKTPLAIKNAGTDIVTYGAPVLPGAMFLLSYKGEAPVIGLPGCVMYAKRTIFDLVLPRIAAGIMLTEEDINCLGEGGLCLSCPVCTYPNCGFGKGM
ncbi:MAG: molybdopterin-binding protein [Lachnospiraceae bacterium]|nr:molybdopterin-binding protein [Candidatus Colinaster scatohippi]